MTETQRKLAVTQGQAVLYGSTDKGFGTNAGTINATIYGKNTAPANGTDGMSLGTLSFADPLTNTAKTINSTNLTSTWNYLWAYFTGNGANMYMGELVLYEWK